MNQLPVSLSRDLSLPSSPQVPGSALDFIRLLARVLGVKTYLQCSLGQDISAESSRAGVSCPTEVVDLRGEHVLRRRGQVLRLADLTAAHGLSHSRAMAQAVQAIGERSNADMIVVCFAEGSSYPTPLDIAEQIIRLAPCPILIVPPSCGGERSMQLREILCATDLFPAAERAIGVALKLAKAVHANVCLCHAVGHLEPTAVGNELLEEAIQNGLKRMLATNVPGVDTTDIVVGRGDPANVILHLIDARQPDLLTLGASGTSSIVSQAHRKIASQLLPFVTCPILTVR